MCWLLCIFLDLSYSQILIICFIVHFQRASFIFSENGVISLEEFIKNYEKVRKPALKNHKTENRTA